MTTTGNPSSGSGGKRISFPSKHPLSSTPRSLLAEANGRTRMAKFRRENKLRNAHTYGAHYHEFFIECEFCRLYLNYSLRHLSDIYFHDPDETPGGFRNEHI